MCQENRWTAVSCRTRAFDSELQRQQTLQLLADYNATLSVTPELDARFGELAAQRIRSAPLRYYALAAAYADCRHVAAPAH